MSLLTWLAAIWEFRWLLRSAWSTKTKFNPCSPTLVPWVVRSDQCQNIEFCRPVTVLPLSSVQVCWFSAVRAGNGRRVVVSQTTIAKAGKITTTKASVVPGREMLFIVITALFARSANISSHGPAELTLLCRIAVVVEVVELLKFQLLKFSCWTRRP